jgi:N-acetylglucosamine kinase-like BadF-type ATPase
MPNFLAVDAGGTSTRTVLVDPHGRCLGYAKHGGGNPISSGREGAAAQIVTGTREVLAAANAEAGDVAGVLLAMAGASTVMGADWIADPLRGIGVDAPVAFESDLLATFFSGTYRPDGYALVAGTGAAAIRVEDGLVAATVDGLGWLLGDVGSGFWIGHRVARTALASLDGRAPQTALAPLLLRELGIDDDASVNAFGRSVALGRAIDALYELRPVQLARFAPLAFEAAGDEAADRIVAEAGSALLSTLDAVAVPHLAGPVILGGGTLSRHASLPELIASARSTDGSRPEIRRVDDGTVGAVVLALRTAGVPVDADVFETVTSSLAALR